MESLEQEISFAALFHYQRGQGVSYNDCPVMGQSFDYPLLPHLVFVIHVAAVAQGVSQTSTDQNWKSQVPINGESNVRKGMRCKIIKIIYAEHLICSVIHCGDRYS